MSKETRCPSCRAGILSFHDTKLHKEHADTGQCNETDQGEGKPYFMCSDQRHCGLIISTHERQSLINIYRKVIA